MGAFILAKNNYSYNVDNLMADKGFSKPHIFPLGDYTLSLYDKILIDEQNYIFNDNQGIFVSGSLAYKGLSYQPSINKLYQDFLQSAIDINELRGTFCVLFYSNAVISVLTDQSNIQNIYYSEDGAILSSSLVVLFEVLPKLTLNKLAVAECFTTGTLVGPDTIFDEIKRYEFHAKPSFTGFSFINKINDSRKVKFFKGSFKDAVNDQVNLLKSYLQSIKNIGEEYGVDSGITGGHDSRLILTLTKDFFSHISFHSHWRKKVGIELQCAQLVCEKAGIPIRIQEIKDPSDMTEEEAEKTFNQAFLYYDGHTRMHCYFNEMINTVDYRAKILGAHKLGLNGIGGEQYRNDEHMLRPIWNFGKWVKYSLIRNIGGAVFTDDKFEKELDSYVGTKIRNKLQLGNKKYITRLDLKRYLNEVLVPGRMGARNNAENQLSFFFSPFSDYPVAQAAYEIVYKLGISFDFEEAMIAAVNPEIASVMSDYGFNFIDGEPMKRKAFHILKEFLPVSYKSKLINKRFNPANSDQNSFYKMPVYQNCLNAVKEINLPANIDHLLLRPDIKGIVYSLGYILIRYKHKIAI